MLLSVFYDSRLALLKQEVDSITRVLQLEQKIDLLNQTTETILSEIHRLNKIVYEQK